MGAPHRSARPGRRRATGARIAGPLCLALLLAACRATGPQNVLLISVDSLRADHLGSYGYGRDTSPAIDAFAREAVLFERAYTQAPWTLPAHASLLTSRYARSHRVDDARARLSPDVPTLASVLAGHGYETAAVVSGPFMKALFGFDTGFRSYDDSLATTHSESHEAVTSPAIHAKALALLDQLEPPFFLMLHYWDVHYDYIPPPPYDRIFDPDYAGQVDGRNFERNPAIQPGLDPRDLQHLVALYDGEVRHLDGYLGRLFQALSERRLMERTLIVVTADHGDEFFEHGAKGHSHSIYEELVHVPLIVRGPGLLHGARVSQPVRHVDVVPTLLDLLEIDRHGLQLQGRSLAPLLRGEPLEAAPVFSETLRFRREKRPGVPFEGAVSVLSDGFKLIRHANPDRPDELYDLRRDPGERGPIEDPEAAARLRALLLEWTAGVPLGLQVRHAGLEADTRERLEALGYIEQE